MIRTINCSNNGNASNALEGFQRFENSEIVFKFIASSKVTEIYDVNY